MKTIGTAIAVTLFSASISAAEIYHGLSDGNGDLYPKRSGETGFIGTQPSVGDSVNRYHGFGDGNPDIFESSRNTSVGARSGSTSNNSQPIYVGPGVQF